MMFMFDWLACEDCWASTRKCEKCLAVHRSIYERGIREAEERRARQHAHGCNDSTEHHAPLGCSHLESWRLM